ncbi:MAG: VOC family protein [Chloroflexi bacterium]|nr:VOC family protein [Chloroflexota bacterium]
MEAVDTRRESQPAAGGPLVRPTGLDHANLHVRDVEASLRFYTELLGLAVRSVMRRDEAGRPTFVELGAGDQTVFLMERRDYRPPADRSARGLNHICLLIEPAGAERLQEALRARGVTIRGTREGHNRQGRPTFSVYVEDPDGHGVELEQVVE